VPTAPDSGEDTYVRGGSKQLRDIEELVDKLRIVTKQLAFPAQGEAGDIVGERKL